MSKIKILASNPSVHLSFLHTMAKNEHPEDSYQQAVEYF